MSEPDAGVPGAVTSSEDQARLSAHMSGPLTVVGIGASAGGLDVFERFLFKTGDYRYQATKQLGETVTSAPQNLISDAPFFRLDLVSCRIDDAAVKRDGGFVPVAVPVKPEPEPDTGEGQLLVIFADGMADGQAGAEVAYPRRAWTSPPRSGTWASSSGPPARTCRPR